MERRRGFAIAFTLGLLVVGAIALSLSSRRDSPVPSSPAAPRGSAVAAGVPGLAIGAVAEVVRPFTIGSDRGVVEGQRVFIVDGPTLRDGVLSYLVQHWGDLEHGIRPDSDFGWVTVDAALTSLRPVAVTCPVGQPALDTIAALQPFERVVCFGGHEIELGPVTTRDYQVGIVPPTWLSDDGNVDFTTAIPYVIDGAVRPLDVLRWYSVTGHFDDTDCGQAAAAQRERCRQRFAVTAAVEVEPPDAIFDGTWRRIAESPLVGRAGAAGAWSGTEVYIWGGDAFDGVRSSYIPDGARYDPVADRWRSLPPAPIDGRVSPVGAWTGAALLVWSGYERHGDRESLMLDGALFDPAAERWTPIPAAPIEATEASPLAIWTGADLVVFSAGMSSGAAFNVATHTWRSIAAPPAASGDTNNPALAWTGSELIALGYPVDDVDTSMAWAAAWDPARDRWRTLPEPGFRSMQGGPALWTGDEVLVLWEANRAFDPATETWRTVANPCGAGPGGLWTGRYAIQNGKAFDIVTETCRNLPPEPERPGGGYREFGVEVWTGSELFFWSGGNGGDGAQRMNDGVIFTPDRPVDR